MTAPGPENHLANAWMTLKELPRWAVVGIVVGGGLIAWYFLKDASDTDTKGIKGIPAVDAGGHPGGGQSSQTYQSFLTSTPGNDATPQDPGTSYADSQDVTSYWYVPVAPAGWSSTFGGIAQQFYGSTARANELQQLNPNLQSTTYGKLPVGAMIKVPRN